MKNQATVFIVDDEAEVRESLSVFLRSEGYAVAAYPSARAFMRAYDDAPGCLLLDILMPGVSGLDLQDWLVTKRSALPVIIITGQRDEVTHSEALLAGAVAFLLKPIDPEELLNHVEHAIGPASSEKAS